MVLLIDPVVDRLRELLATLEPPVLRRIVACHRQLETTDIEAAAADAVFADGQHVPELFKLARLPSQQRHTQGHAARDERMTLLLRRIGRLLSLAAVTIIEVPRPIPAPVAMLLKQYGGNFPGILKAAAVRFWNCCLCL